MIAPRADEGLRTDGLRTPRSAPRIRSVATVLVKLAVTFAACGWILRMVDWAQFGRTVEGIAPWLIVLVFLMRSGGLTLSAFKWQQLLAVHGATYRLGRLVRWYLVAMFLNNFLPTSIGGDGYRIYRTLDNLGGRSAAVLAILVERATGLLALFALGLVAGVAMSLSAPDPLVTIILLVSACGILSAVVAVFLVVRFSAPGGSLPRYRWARWLKEGLGRIRDYNREPSRAMLVGALSFVFHLNKIFATWLLLYALDAPIDPIVLTLMIVAGEVVGLLPISLGGLGVVDGSFVYLATHFGVPPEPALATMLLLRVLNLPLALAGGHFYLVAKRETEAVDPQRTVDVNDRVLR